MFCGICGGGTILCNTSFFWIWGSFAFLEKFGWLGLENKPCEIMLPCWDWDAKFMESSG